MQTISATALENLKRLAKQHRDVTGLSLTDALEAVARQAGYAGWKQVTMLAGAHEPSLMPARHNWRTHWVYGGGRPYKCTTTEELCEALSGVRPVLFRSHCDHSSPGARCLCEMDPFVTSKRANVFVDIGDKHDFWNYLYFPDRPYTPPNIFDVRVNLGLGSHGHYINEHLLDDTSNINRSNSLNPNNSAYRHALDNRANQLNPNNKRFSPDS